jgi:hypothetical protein
MAALGQFEPVAAPLDFQPGNLLWWPEQLGTAKSGFSVLLMQAI